MTREERAGSTDTFVSDDSEDPLTCPLTQRLFHGPLGGVAALRRRLALRVAVAHVCLLSHAKYHVRAVRA
jgi:hypothetical protein